jgi:hypothetical protein
MPRAKKRSRKSTRRSRSRKPKNYSRKRRRTRTYSRPKGPRMSACARDYLVVQYAPFSGNPLSAPCIPDDKAFPSLKFFLKKRFTMVSGSITSPGGTMAAALLNPSTIDNGGSDYCVSYTDGATMADNTLKFSTTTGWNLDNWDSGHGATIGANNVHRCVAAGIRVSYTGEWQTCKGQVVVYSSPTNAAIAGTEKVSDLLKLDEVAYSPLENGKVYEAVYHPRKNIDYDYQASNMDKAGCVGIIVTGADAAAEFMVEVIGWYEAIGPDINGATQSHSDIVALGHINALPKRQTAGATGLMGVVDAYKEAFYESAKTYAAPAATVGMSMAAKAVGAYFGV